MPLSHRRHERGKTVGGSSLEMARLRATLLPLVSQWSPASWARAGWEEVAHQISWRLLRPLLPPFFFCSFLATELLSGDIQILCKMVLCQMCATKCERERSWRGTGDRDMGTRGKVNVSWLKFKPTNRCEWKTGRKWRGRWWLSHNTLKEHVRPFRTKSASQIPLSKRSSKLHPHILCILPLWRSPRHPACQAGIASPGWAGKFHRLDQPERSVSQGAEQVPFPSARTELTQKDWVIPRSQSATWQNSRLPLSRQGGLICLGNACLMSLARRMPWFDKGRWQKLGGWADLLLLRILVQFLLGVRTGDWPVVRWALHECFAGWIKRNLFRILHITREKIEHSAVKCLWHSDHVCFLKFGLPLVSETVLSCLPPFWSLLPQVLWRILSIHGALHGVLPLVYFLFMLQHFLLG